MNGGLPSGLARLRRLAREGTWVGAGLGLDIAARLVGLRLITELVAPSTYGEVVLLVGVLALARDVFCTPILTTTLRYYPEAAAQDRRRALRDLMARLLGQVTLLSAAFLVLGAGLWLAFSEVAVGPWSLALLAALLAVDVRRMFGVNLLNAARRQTAFSLWAGSDAWARALTAVGLILWLGPTALSILAGYALGTGLVVLLFQRFVVGPPADRREGDAEWAAGIRGEILRYALPLAPVAVLGWISGMGDRYVLAELASAEQVGIYAAAIGVASQPFLFVGNTVALTLRPVLFEAFAAGDGRRKRQALWTWLALLVAAFVPGLVLIWLLAAPVARLLLGEAFWGAAPLLVWVGAAFAAQAIQNAFSSLIYAEGRTRLLIVIHAVTAVSALAFYWILIPRYGVMGAALAALAAKSTSCVTTFFVARAHATLRAPTPAAE